MKLKRLLFSTLIVLAGFLNHAIAQVDTTWWKSLIISEVNMTTAANQIGYIEVANAGDSVISLADYWIQGSWGWTGAHPFLETTGKWSFLDSTTLAPGETYLISVRRGNASLDEYGSPRFPNGYYNPYIEALGDYIHYSSGLWGGYLITGETLSLCYRGDADMDGVKDSVLFDQFYLTRPEKDYKPDAEFPIAGLITNNPRNNYIYARKSFVKKGNPDFNFTRGTNVDDSEWMPIPPADQRNQFSKPFTTLKNFGGSNTDLVLKSLRPEITIDFDNNIINFPYGIRRDSIFWNFETGINHAWNFRPGPDSAQFYISNGDSLDFYVCADKRVIYSFHANVAPIPTNFVQVRPHKYREGNNTWFSQRYTVSSGLALDTIGGLNYAEPVDTLLRHIIIENNNAYEFIWVDGIERPEIKDGDILRITSGDLSKDYKLIVKAYAPSFDADLRSIYFPGLTIFENPKTYEYTDTLIQFTSGNPNYVVDLPEGTTIMPGIIATPNNNRAKVYIERAKNLSGNDDSRTATITVTAENDTTIKKYHVLFNVIRPAPPVEGTLFYSDIAASWSTNNKNINIQVYNPTDNTVDLTHIMLMKLDANKSDFQTFWETPYNNEKAANAWILNPGNKAILGEEAGTVFFTMDDHKPKFELDAKDVLVLTDARGIPNGTRYNQNPNKEQFDQVDFWIGSRGPKDEMITRSLEYFKMRFSDEFPNNMYGNGGYWLWNGATNDNNTGLNGYSYAILEILNDSIVEGTKAVFSDFAKNYKVLDVVNGFSSLGIPWTIYDKVNGIDSAFRFAGQTASGYKVPLLGRKDWVYTGNPIDLASFGSEANEGEWMVYGMDADGNYTKTSIPGVTLGGNEYGATRFNNHIMLSYAHIPYITSKQYLISEGIEGEQSILGIPTNTSVSEFMQNIIKPDAKMSVIVKDVQGNEVAGEDKILTSYKVYTTSANGKSSLTYAITVGSLSSDVSLTAKTGSGVSVEGLKVMNVPFGTTIKALIEKLETAATSTMLVTDGLEYQIPLTTYSKDTINIANRITNDVLVSDTYVIEVSAQDGINKAKYSIEFANEESVYVLSDVYKVYEDFKNIDFVQVTNVDNFLANIVPSPGATMHVINKMSQIRVDGRMQRDDRLLVQKGNTKVVYLLKFTTDKTWGVGANNVRDDLNMSAYPNPTLGNVTINNLKGATVLQVRNITGQLVKTITVNSDNVQFNLDGSAGIYFVSLLRNNTVIETSKIIKE